MSHQEVTLPERNTNTQINRADKYYRNFNVAVINASTFTRIYRKSPTEIPDEYTQVRESLANLASGNYRDIPIEEYLKELDE